MLCFYLWIILQVLLESFPVSSSGHVKLFEHYIKNNCSIFSDCGVFMAKVNDAAGSRSDILDHFMHWPTLLIIALFFFSQWYCLLKLLLSSMSTVNSPRNERKRILGNIIGYTFIAQAITVVIYCLFKWTMLATFFPLGLGFAITAGLLFSLYFVPKRAMGTFNWRSALALGLVQGCALLPGISRFASTFVCARWLAISPRRSFEISWLLAAPIMSIAFLKSLWDISKNVHLQTLITERVFIVMIIAGIVSYIAFTWVAKIAYKNQLWVFALYMIIPIIIWLALVLS